MRIQGDAIRTPCSSLPPASMRVMADFISTSERARRNVVAHAEAQIRWSDRGSYRSCRRRFAPSSLDPDSSCGGDGSVHTLATTRTVGVALPIVWSSSSRRRRSWWGSPDRVCTRTFPTAPVHVQSTESVPGLLPLASGRPALSMFAKLGDAQGWGWATPLTPTPKGFAVSRLAGSHTPLLELSDGPVAKGLTGRGPPSFAEP
jgi:hypothetical protein